MLIFLYTCSTSIQSMYFYLDTIIVLGRLLQATARWLFNMCPGVLWNSFLVYDTLVTYLSVYASFVFKLICFAQVYVHCVPFVYIFLHNLFLLT